MEKDYYRGNLFKDNLKNWDYERYMRVHRCDDCEARIFCNCVCPLVIVPEQQESYCKYKKAEYTRLLGALVEMAPFLINEGGK